MNALLWPASRASDALAALSGQAPLAPPTGDVTGEWIEATAKRMGMEAQPLEMPYPDFERRLPDLGPAFIHLPGKNAVLAIVRGSTVLLPDRSKLRMRPATLRSLLCADMEAAVAAEIQQLLDSAEIPASKQPRAHAAILRERFKTRRISGIWLLRLPPSASFAQQLRRAGVPQRLLGLALAHAIQYVLWIVAWWVVGRNVLGTSTSHAWLLTWALLLFALIPLRVLITWLQGVLAISAGALLKQRLFFGALRLEPDSIRHQGAGQLLGRVIESEAVEALALSGGFLALVAVIELVISLFVLGRGAGGLLQSALLAAWLVATGLLVRQYFQRNQLWTDVRLDMTHQLVENMVGHRTRLAQLAPDRWHDGEDEALRRYQTTSKGMDDTTAMLLAIVPRGWLVIALLGLAPALARGGDAAAPIAIAVGGMLLAYRALKRLTSGAWQLASAAVAWERVSGLYHSAARPDLVGTPEAMVKDPAVVDARDLVFRYNKRNDPVLRGCNLRISPGDRLMLEGPSGGGKSTLVALLVGLREPDSGELLLSGLDRKTLGAEAWRKHIAAAPQFHENHVLAETLAFNALMGRRRAPSPDDLPQAEQICRELGLGELLDRMPAGMLQMVGETGWQLSHGERSRLYIARALLQDADVIILDESFAALDPVNLKRALESVVARARALLVISHR
jgi:ATP-binding cassette, subfamily B, bacterial